MITLGGNTWCSITIDDAMLHTNLIKIKTWRSVSGYEARFLNLSLQTKLVTHLPSWKESESPIHQESTPSRPEARSASWVWQHKCFLLDQFSNKITKYQSLRLCFCVWLNKETPDRIALILCLCPWIRLQILKCEKWKKEIISNLSSCFKILLMNVIWERKKVKLKL